MFIGLTKGHGNFLSSETIIHRDIITYLVSSRPYIEICRVCKIYGRRGGVEPSIYFTNPTFFYVRSGTDQISVLFRRGPLFVYTGLRKIRKFIRTADKLTTSMLARKCGVASCATSQYYVIDAGMKVKANFEVLWVRKSRQKATSLGCKMCDM